MRARTTRSGPLTVLLAGVVLLGCAGVAVPSAVAAATSEAAAASGRPAAAQGKVDLNSASLEQLRGLPIAEEIASAIYDYRQFVSYFGDIYDLREVPGVTGLIINTLKPLVAVLPPPEGDAAIARMTASYRQVRNYLSQEGSNEGLVDEYLDLMQEPANVNDLDLFELMSFQNVSPVDAANIIKARRRLGGFTGGRQLRRAEGLRYFAYRNLRDFVVYDDSQLGPDRVRVDYQVRYYDTPIYGGDDDAAYIRGINSQLVNPAMSHKLRVDLPRGFRAGARSFRGLSEAEWDETMKAFVEVKDKTWGPFKLKRAVVGNYRVAFGLGLFMDNTDFVHFRKTGYGWNKRPLGVRGDLSRTHQYKLTGAAAEGSLGPAHVTLFASSDKRAGIVNPDGTVNRYLLMNPRPDDEGIDAFTTQVNGQTIVREAFQEDVLGGNLKWMFAPGTYLGASVMQSNFDRAFDSQPSTIIDGGTGSEYWEARDSEIAAGYTSVFEDADAGTRTEYKWRRIYGLEGQAVVNNVAFQGEYGRLQDPRQGFLAGAAPDAMIFNTFAQWDNFHILASYRDYDIGFDNPYMRSFSNDSKYEQTIIDSSYRLNEPLYVWLSTDNPQPKGERGMFVDMRYRISRQFIINGLQFDQWERKADGADLTRLTAKVEYQPKFNLRFRMRHRVSSRTEQNPEDVRTFRSWENRVQMIALLSHYNRLQLTYVTGNVNFPARQRLSYPAPPGDPDGDDRSGVGTAGSPAFAFEARYEHHVTPWLTLTLAGSVYDGFFWNFEGNEFVLLDSEGWRQWFKVESRVSERMLVQLKVTKDHKSPGTYLDNRDFGADQPPTPDATYIPRDDLYVRLQIDYSF